MATQGVNLSSYDKKKTFKAEPFRFGIVLSKWNYSITEALYRGYVDTLKDFGASQDNLIYWEVPGSFELIFGAKKMLKTQEVDAVVVIGSLIRGETSHFDYISQGVTHGIKDLNVVYDVPVIFCVLTDDTMQQAKDRSGGKHGNKGVEAAVTTLEMIYIAKK